MSHVEAERLRNNANLTGHRGKRSELPGGEQFVEVKDPLTVLDKIPGTPKYWQKFKYDMIAKLENLGPFHMFFTLSCADMRWSANFTPVLEKLGCKLFYEVDKEGHENVTVEVVQSGKTMRLPWKQYLDEYVDAKQHDLIRQNVLLATRNFHHRVEVFRREVIFGRNNPMKVRHISYRVEFQGRGAGHIHGVLWLDMKELKVEGAPNELLVQAFEKLRYSQALEEDEVRSLERFTDAFVTCTRCISVAGKEAVEKAEEVNWHGHSSSCRKEGPPGQCRWKFPKFPLARTTFVDANREVPKEEFKMKKINREEILRRVMAVLVEEEGGKMVLSKEVERIMTSFPNVKKKDDEHLPSKPQQQLPSTSEEHVPQQRKPNKITYVKMESPEEYDENIRKRIEMVLKIASAGGEPITYHQYEMAVA